MISMISKERKLPMFVKKLPTREWMILKTSLEEWLKKLTKMAS
jgi:hypothetical protein